MKPAEIRALSDQQIDETIDELREEWRSLRFDDAVGRLTQTKRIREVKRDIARLKTIQTERVLAQEYEARVSSSGS
jgi:large subunit ribosomal protein L29